MEFLKLGKKNLHFYRRSGEVLSQYKHSETHISSSGGSASVSRHGTNVNAPTISSNVVTKHEVWLKQEDGNEYSFTLINENIPIREGQQISLIFCGLADENSGKRSALVNHSSNKYWLLKDAESLDKDLGFIERAGILGRINIILFVLASINALFIYFSSDDKIQWYEAISFWLVTLISFSLYFIFKIIPMTKKEIKSKQKLNAHLKALALDPTKL